MNRQLRLGKHPCTAQSKMMGRGPTTAISLFRAKITSGIYHTGHDFDPGMKSFQPLDGQK
jgi:hypothetical protein